MLNNWDDPFAKFANKKSSTTDTAADQAGNEVINSQTLESIEPVVSTPITSPAVTSATAGIPEASVPAYAPYLAPVSKVSAPAQSPNLHPIEKTPHAGDGLVTNEQLMATAGAAPQVNPIIEDIDAATDLSGTGLEEIEMGASRIQVDDKKIINCRADLNQLVPFKYDWAWQKL